MKKIFLLLLAATAVNFCFAQHSTQATPTTPAKADIKTESGQPVYTLVEEMPSFPGGDEKLHQFLKNNIQYPKEAQEAKKEGKVYVSFVVGETGKISDVRVTKRMAYGMDQEAMRVVKMMPDWTPGKQDGQPVAVQYMLPIHFALGNTQAK